MLPALLVSAQHETLDEIEGRAVPRERGKAFPVFTKPEDAQAWQFVKTKGKDRDVHQMDGGLWMPNDGTHPR